MDTLTVLLIVVGWYLTRHLLGRAIWGVAVVGIAATCYEHPKLAGIAWTAATSGMSKTVAVNLAWVAIAVVLGICFTFVVCFMAELLIVIVDLLIFVERRPRTVFLALALCVVLVAYNHPEIVPRTAEIIPRTAEFVRARNWTLITAGYADMYNHMYNDTDCVNNRTCMIDKRLVAFGTVLDECNQVVAGVLTSIMNDSLLPLSAFLADHSMPEAAAVVSKAALLGTDWIRISVDLHFLVLKALVNAEATGCKMIDSVVHANWTLLHEACWHGRKDAVETLIRVGADVNVAAAHGNTPLHFAYTRGYADIVAILLRAGADPEKVDGLKDILHAAKELK